MNKGQLSYRNMDLEGRQSSLYSPSPQSETRSLSKVINFPPRKSFTQMFKDFDYHRNSGASPVAFKSTLEQISENSKSNAGSKKSDDKIHIESASSTSNDLVHIQLIPPESPVHHKSPVPECRAQPIKVPEEMHLKLMQPQTPSGIKPTGSILSSGQKTSPKRVSIIEPKDQSDSKAS